MTIRGFASPSKACCVPWLCKSSLPDLARMAAKQEFTAETPQGS
jgi:hypothetical protein